MFLAGQLCEGDYAMQLKVLCAECGAYLAGFVVSGPEQTIEVRTCRCKPHVFDEKETVIYQERKEQ